MLKQLIAQYTTTPGKIVVPRQIKPGAVLVREWKGQSHRVVVLELGFAYQNRPYESLSEVARLITGTRWNGPKFLRSPERQGITVMANKTMASKTGKLFRCAIYTRKSTEHGLELEIQLARCPAGGV